MICYLPKTAKELSSALACCTDHSRILAGGTEVIIQSRIAQFEPDILICLSAADWMRKITYTEKDVYIGAAVTMAEIAHSKLLRSLFGALSYAAANVGSPQIRNKGTIGGNLCNASPAGDMLPVCLLFDAGVEVLDSNGAVTLIPASDFFLGPKKNCLQTGQAVIGIRLDRDRWEGFRSSFQKIGSRSYVSIARESLGVAVRLSARGVIEDARITLGAVAPVPIRVKEAEEMMLGKKLDNALIREITPLIADTIYKSCRPANRLYKVEAAKGLVADAFGVLLSDD